MSGANALTHYTPVSGYLPILGVPRPLCQRRGQGSRSDGPGRMALMLSLVTSSEN
jgi:hypothetical protein